MIVKTHCTKRKARCAVRRNCKRKPQGTWQKGKSEKPRLQEPLLKTTRINDFAFLRAKQGPHRYSYLQSPLLSSDASAIRLLLPYFNEPSGSSPDAIFGSFFTSRGCTKSLTVRPPTRFFSNSCCRERSQAFPFPTSVWARWWPTR